MPTPPGLSHPSMRRPTRPPTSSETHPLASFTVPSRLPLATSDDTSTAPAPATSSSDTGIVDLPQAEPETDPPSSGAAQTGEGAADAPEGSASALNYLVDAVDYLDWDLHLPSFEARGGSGGGSGGLGAGLGDSMGAVLEAQRLLSRAQEGAMGDGEGDGQEGEGAQLGEHAALLMEFGQGGGQAGPSGEKRGYEEDEGEGGGGDEDYHGGVRSSKRARTTTIRRGVVGTSARKGKGRRQAAAYNSDDNNNPGESSSAAGQRTKSANLTEAQRKANHTLSEKRRRNALKIGYAELGCLEHISVNEWWPSGERLVDAEGAIKEVEGVEIAGRLAPLMSRPKKRTKKEIKAREAARARGEEVESDGEEDGTGEGKPLEKQPPNRVAKGWSKVSVLKKGAALAKWLREGNDWLEEEVRRLEGLLGEERMDIGEMRRVMEMEQSGMLVDHGHGLGGGGGAAGEGHEGGMGLEEAQGEFERDILGVAADQLEEMFRGQ